MTESNIRSLRFDTAVVTPCALNLRDGLLAHDLDDAAVKRAGLESAGRVIVACSGTKWNASAVALVASLDAVDVLVTDKQAQSRRTCPAHPTLGGSSDRMTKTATRPQLNAAAAATFLIFGINGLVFASWAARIPAVTDILDISSGQMGTLLLCVAAGSLIALPTAGHVVGRIGTANAVRAAGLVAAAAGVGVALALLAESVPGTAFSQW